MTITNVDDERIVGGRVIFYRLIARHVTFAAYNFNRSRPRLGKSKEIAVHSCIVTNMTDFSTGRYTKHPLFVRLANRKNTRTPRSRTLSGRIYTC